MGYMFVDWALQITFVRLPFINREYVFLPPNNKAFRAQHLSLSICIALGPTRAFSCQFFRTNSTATGAINYWIALSSNYATECRETMTGGRSVCLTRQSIRWSAFLVHYWSAFVPIHFFSSLLCCFIATRPSGYQVSIVYGLEDPTPGWVWNLRDKLG